MRSDIQTNSTPRTNELLFQKNMIDMNQMSAYINEKDGKSKREREIIRRKNRQKRMIK